MAKKSDKTLKLIAAAGILVVLGGGFALYEMQEARRLAAQTAAAWQISGPACPVPAPGAALPPLPREMGFEEVAIAREVAGAVVCEKVKENGVGVPLKICQFITPGAIKVTTAKGTYSFAPRRGVDASLIVRDDVPSCVQHVNPALFN